MEWVKDYMKQIDSAADAYELDCIVEDAASNDYITNAEYCFVYGEAMHKLQEMSK